MVSITLDKSKIEISKFTTFEGGRKRRMKKKNVKSGDNEWTRLKEIAR